MRRIRNLIRWIPIIWKDRDWDFYFTYEILKKKLEFQAEFTRKHGYHMYNAQDANRMETCVRLIKKLQHEEYIIIPVTNRKYTEEDFKKDQMRHDKARKLLFRILEQNIEGWWD
jgi:hypothetical protein